MGWWRTLRKRGHRVVLWPESQADLFTRKGDVWWDESTGDYWRFDGKEWVSWEPGRPYDWARDGV